MSTSTAELDTENTADGESVADESKTSDVSEIEADQAVTDGVSEPQERWIRRTARRWRPIAVVCVLLASASSAAALYFGVYRVDHGNAAAAATVIDAASDGSVALLSYAPDSLDRDFAAARSRLTGDFLAYYSDFADKFVAPAAKQKDIEPPPRWFVLLRSPCSPTPRRCWST